MDTVITLRACKVLQISLTNWKTCRYPRKISPLGVSRLNVTYSPQKCTVNKQIIHVTCKFHVKYEWSNTS